MNWVAAVGKERVDDQVFTKGGPTVPMCVVGSGGLKNDSGYCRILSRAEEAATHTAQAALSLESAQADIEYTSHAASSLEVAQALIEPTAGARVPWMERDFGRKNGTRSTYR